MRTHKTPKSTHVPQLKGKRVGGRPLSRKGLDDFVNGEQVDNESEGLTRRQEESTRTFKYSKFF